MQYNARHQLLISSTHMYVYIALLLLQLLTLVHSRFVAAAVQHCKLAH